MLECTKILQIPYEGMGYFSLFLWIPLYCVWYTKCIQKKKKKKITCQWIKAHVWNQNMTILDNEFSHLDRDTFVD